LQAQHPVDLAVARREHQHGDHAIGAQAAAHLDPVEGAGQAHVEDDHAGLLPLDDLEPLFAVVRLQDAETFPAQVHVDQVGDVGIVLDHDDRAEVLAGGHRSSLAPGCYGSVNWRGSRRLVRPWPRTSTRSWPPTAWSRRRTPVPSASWWRRRWR